MIKGIIIRGCEIKKKVEYYESNINEYVDEFINSTIDDSLKILLTEKVENYKERINQLNTLKKEIKEQGKSQICLTDPSLHLINQMILTYVH